MQLTQIQQRDVENSLWVVNSALKKLGIKGNEDLRQTALLHMCRCRLRFDPSIKCKWTTYAYKSVILYLTRCLKIERKKRAVLIDEDLFDLVEPMCKTHDDEARNTLEEIKGVCDPEENKVLELTRQGYKGKEIGTIMKCSTKSIYECMHSIKDKARAMVRGG